MKPRVIEISLWVVAFALLVGSGYLIGRWHGHESALAEFAYDLDGCVSRRWRQP